MAGLVIEMRKGLGVEGEGLSLGLVGGVSEWEGAAFWSKAAK